MIKDRPHRLDLIYFRSPLFFVTLCTRNRTKIPSLDLAQRAIENYAPLGIRNFDVALGKYVIMADHVHLFVRDDHSFVLSTWVGGLKRAISVAVLKQRLWQPGFFDHVLRSGETYAEKWNYVQENPVQAGLVDHAADWPYQGETVVIDRVTSPVAAGVPPARLAVAARVSRACIGELQPTRLPLQEVST